MKLQNCRRSEICPTREGRADVTLPKGVLVCWPVKVLKTAEVFTPENWVWLKAL